MVGTVTVKVKEYNGADVAVCGKCGNQMVSPEVDERCDICGIQLLWTIEAIQVTIEYTTVEAEDMLSPGPWTSEVVRETAHAVVGLGIG